MRALTLILIGFFILNTGCETAGKKTAVGTGIGVAAGAAVGAVLGHQSGNRAAGAMMGAAVGGAIGGAIGYKLDKQAKELKALAETKRTEHGIVTKLKSDILFDTGKSDLKPGAVTNISKMAAIIKKYPEDRLVIRGYTDSTGSAKVNEALSQGRAGAVQDQLVRGGVPADTIQVVGMGPANPIGDNKSETGRAQNRRVEIEITMEEKTALND